MSCYLLPDLAGVWWGPDQWRVAEEKIWPRILVTSGPWPSGEISGFLGGESPNPRTLGLGGGNVLVRSRRGGGSMAGASAGRAYVERIERDHEGSPLPCGHAKSAV